MNEGGADNNVEGEPPGTTGRVEAEEKRVNAARLAYLRIATLVAIPVVLISMIPWGVAYVLLDRTDDRLATEITERCEETAFNRGAIRATVIDGLEALGYAHVNGQIVERGKPLAYYVDHPDERAGALARTKATLARFPVIDCGR